MAATWLAAGGELPFGVKPPQPVVNRGHPLAQGLVFDVQYEALGGASVDLAYGAKGAFTGTTASIPGVGPHGALRTFASGANTAVDTYVTPAPVNGLTRLTLEALVKFNGVGNGGGGDGRVIWKGGATTYTALTWLAGNVTLDFGWSTTAGSWSTTSGVVTQSVWHHIVTTYDFASTGSVPRLWVDGVEAALTLNTTPAGSPLADTTALLIGNRPAGDRAINANLSHIRLWNRRFTGGEVAQLYADPFQLYVRPTPPILYGLPPASGSYAMEATGSGAGTATADMLASRPMAASNAGIGTATASMLATRPLAAAGTGLGSEAADMRAARPMTATGSGLGSEAADMVKGVLLAATSSGAGSQSADMGRTVPLAANDSAAGGETAQMLATRPMSATGSGQGAQSADMGSDGVTPPTAEGEAMQRRRRRP